MSILDRARNAAAKGGATKTSAPKSGYYVADIDSSGIKILARGSIQMRFQFEGFGSSLFLDDPSATLQKTDTRVRKWIGNDIDKVVALAFNLGVLQNVIDSDSDFNSKKPSPPSAKRLVDNGVSDDEATAFAQAQVVFARLGDAAWMGRQKTSQVVVKWSAAEPGARNKKGDVLYGDIIGVYPLDMLAELRAGPPVADRKGFAGAPAATSSSASANAAAASADVPGDEDIPF
jgi:hypothetical protein